MKNFNRNLRIILFLTWIASGFICFSQSTITQTSTIPFGNTDNWQNNWALRRILDALLSPSTPSAATSIKDISADTLTNRILRIVNAQETYIPSLATIKQYLSPGFNYANYVKGTTSVITTTATTDVISAPGASTYIYITDILVTNSSSSVGTFVKIIEETSGTILWRGYAASGGGGFSCSLNTPIKTGTANKKVQVVCETGAASVVVNISGFKGL